MAELSPMMQQYMDIKKQYKDEILFYRIGDFYEMFFDDAMTASRELDLTLTGKQCGMEERAPMCGVPFHSYEGYVARLIAKGYKVAICEQMEDPSKAKGLVKRDIIRVVTPDLCGAKAGLQAGDIVTKIDNTDVTSASDLTSAIGNYKPGDKVTLTIFRSGETKTVEVTLEESTPEKTEKQNQAQQEYQQEYQQSQQRQQQSQQQQQGSSGWPFGSFGY